MYLHKQYRFHMIIFFLSLKHSKRLYHIITTFSVSIIYSTLVGSKQRISHFLLTILETNTQIENDISDIF